MQKSLEKGSGWNIDLFIDHIVSISKYNPLAGICYIKSSNELDHPRKGFIDIDNIDDNECFIWCLVKYLNLADHNPKKSAKVYKDFEKTLDFKDVKFPIKIRDIKKIEKRFSLVLAFFVRKTK